MYDITLDIEHARTIRDALSLLKQRWPGGDPAEQERIIYLESEFNKMILESYLDAWCLTMERGLGLLSTNYVY